MYLIFISRNSTNIYKMRKKLRHGLDQMYDWQQLDDITDVNRVHFLEDSRKIV